MTTRRWPWLLLVPAGALVALGLSQRPTASKSEAKSHDRAAASTAAPVIENQPMPQVALVAPDAATVAEGVRSEIPWGPNGLGRGTSEDGFPGGPNSFVTGADGSTWVLDQFNHRMVRLGPDGKILETRATKLQSPADLAIGKDGSMAVIDRTRGQQVELFDAQGRSRGTLPLPDSVQGQPSELTRVFVNDDKVLAQRGEGGPLIPLGGTDGTAASGASEINGQPSRDGLQLISAGITDGDSGRVWVSGADPATQAQLWTRETTLGNPLEQILLLDSDLGGMIYFVVKASYDTEGGASTLVLCLEGNQRGRITKIFSLPYPNAPLDTFRKYDVVPSGGLVAAEYTEMGVTYRTHSCR